jgi:Domain of unknown function (DUF5666)
MTRHRARRLIVSLAVTTLAIACTGQSNSSSGQSPTAPGTSSGGDTPNPAPAGAEVEFTGTLTSISSSTPGATLVVAGRTVHTSAATVVRRRGDSIAFSSLRTGQTVEVRGTSEASGSVLANRLTIEDDAVAEQEIEFSGTISSISGSGPGATLVVAGRTVLTNASTVVRRRGDPVGFDRIRVGQRAEIKGVQQGGTVLATRITLDDD